MRIRPQPARGCTQDTRGDPDPEGPLGASFHRQEIESGRDDQRRTHRLNAARRDEHLEGRRKATRERCAGEHDHADRERHARPHPRDVRDRHGRTASTRLKDVSTQATDVIATSNSPRISRSASVTIDESASASAIATPSSGVRTVSRLAESGREHLDQGDRGPRIGGEGGEELFARDRDAADRPLGVDVRDATAARVEHLDLADQLAHAENDRAARALDAHRALEHEQELRTRLADPHDGVAVLELACLPQREDRIEELAREHREHARVAHEPLVAPAVEEQRLAVPVARVLDLSEEERVVAAPVRADDASHEVRERSLDERRLAHELEARLGRALGRSSCEVVGELGLARLQHVHADPRPLVEQVRHPRAAVDRDEHERRTQRNRHERVRCHPVHASPTRVVSTVTPVANMPSVRRNAIAGSPSSPLPSSSVSAAGAASNDAPNASGAEIALVIATSNSCGSERSITTDSDDDAELVEAAGYAAGATVFRCR